jgi:hypothetical protein
VPIVTWFPAPDLGYALRGKGMQCRRGWGGLRAPALRAPGG